MDKNDGFPNKLELYRVKYEGESYVFAESPEDAIAKYKNASVEEFIKVIETEKVATYLSKEGD